MFKHTVTFTGRKKDALGITYTITAETTTEATDIQDIRLSLYDRFEHIGEVTILKTEGVNE